MAEPLDKISFPTVFSYVFISAPILLYYFCVYWFGVNIPFWDDYDTLKQNINFFSTDNISKQTSILFGQHNEHRIAFNRMVFVLFQLLFQKIDFKLLPLIGNSALIFLFLFYFKNLSNFKYKLFLLIPIAWALFQLQNWRNMTWTIASLSNLHVLSFAAISFYFLSKDQINYYCLGFLFTFLAVFSQGSGMGILPVFWCYLLAIKKYKESFIWLIGVFILVTFYFMGYEKPGTHPSILESLKNQTQLWGYFFMFLGGIIFFSKKLAFFCGLTFFILFVYLTIKKYYLKKPSLFLFIAFLILTGFIAALTRSGFGIEQALAPRYKIISILLSVSLYIFVAEWVFSSKKWNQTFLTFSFIISITFYFFSFEIGLFNLKTHQIQMIKGIKNWKETKKGLAFPQQKIANKTLLLALKKGIYKLPRLVD